MNTPKPMIGQWDSRAGPQASVGLAHSGRVTTKAGIIQPDGKGFVAQEYLVEVLKSSPTGNEGKLVELLRETRFATRPEAEAQVARWQQEHHRSAVALRRKTNAPPKPLPRGPENANPIKGGSIVEARSALRFALCRKFPNSMDAMNRGERDPNKITDAYHLDAAELTGEKLDVSPALTSEVLKALRRSRRSPHKQLDREIDIAVALNWIVSGWCFKSYQKIAGEISTMTKTEVSAYAARKRVERLNLTTLKPRGPSPNAH